MQNKYASRWFGLLAAVVGCFLFVWMIKSCSGSSSSDSSSSETAATHESSADLRTKREPAQTYWNGVIGYLALAGAAISFAGQAEQSGDAVSAQQFLTIAEKQADLASSASLQNTPDGWNDISSSLYNAADTYKKAIGEFKDGLGSGNSEQIASALDDAKSAGDTLTDATHDARVWYMNNGGKWSDIEDYQHVEKTAESTLKSLENQ